MIQPWQVTRSEGEDDKKPPPFPGDRVERQGFGSDERKGPITFDCGAINRT